MEGYARRPLRGGDRRGRAGSRRCWPAGRKGRKDPIPFGPFLAAGGTAALFWGRRTTDMVPERSSRDEPTRRSAWPNCMVVARDRSASSPPLGTPFVHAYIQSAALKAAAQELATIISGARQLAIARNTNVCVTLVGNQAIYRIRRERRVRRRARCSSARIRGPTATMRLDNSMTISGTTANVVFSALGAAVTAGTYTVRNPTTNSTLTVVVASHREG